MSGLIKAGAALFGAGARAASALATSTKAISGTVRGIGTVGGRTSQIAKLTKAPPRGVSNIYRAPPKLNPAGSTRAAGPKGAAKPTGAKTPSSAASKVSNTVATVGTTASISTAGLSLYSLYRDVDEVVDPNGNDNPLTLLEDLIKDLGGNIENLFSAAGSDIGKDFQGIESGFMTAGKDISWGIGEIEAIAPVAIGGVALVALLLLVR